jgi:hypothetical protein
MTILVPGEIGIKTFGVSTKTTRNLIDPVTSQPTLSEGSIPSVNLLKSVLYCINSWLEKRLLLKQSDVMTGLHDLIGNPRTYSVERSMCHVSQCVLQLTGLRRKQLIERQVSAVGRIRREAELAVPPNHCKDDLRRGESRQEVDPICLDLAVLDEK